MIRRLLLCLLALAPAAARAGALSGSVTLAAGGVPAAGAVEVQLWKRGSGVPPEGKGFSLSATTLVDAAGAYAFAPGQGTWRISARMAPGVGGNLGDRWYDVAPPLAGGYVAEAADDLAFPTGAETRTGIDLALEVLGGLDGTLAGSQQAGVLVRAESRADVRIHHLDAVADAPHLGEYSFRGLVPGSYRLLAHDPFFREDDLLADGPWAVAPGATATGPALAMPALPADPYEQGGRNDTFATGADLDGAFAAACAGAAGGRCFGSPHAAFDATAGGRTPYIGPINTGTGAGDVDFFCFAVAPGDRFLARAWSPLARAGGGAESPWVDPTLSFWLDGALVLSDDDSLGGAYRAGATLDTRDLVAAAGRACVAVSTFGDVGFTGHGNQSAGRYFLTVELGNRRPSVAATAAVDGVPAPVPVAMSEGQTLQVDAAFSDPDSPPDALSLSATLTDRDGAQVGGSTLTRGAGTARFVWSADQIAARRSPYLVTFVVGDGEFSASAEVPVNVKAINLAPSRPAQLLPANGARVASRAPALVVLNATDPDQEPILLDFELYDVNGGLLSAGSASQAAGDRTSWVPPALPENQLVFWRVRANDGHAGDNCCSPWTATWQLRVDTQNQPPGRPELVKPGATEVVRLRGPALAATCPEDPEGDPITLEFQVAEDADFARVVAAPTAPRNPLAASTAAALGGALAWGGSYQARVRASDSLGAKSTWSEAVHFSVKPDAPPPSPRLVGPFDGACREHVFTLGPPPTVQLSRVEDPDGEEVRLELQLFTFEQDPSTAAPLFQTGQPQAALGGATAMDLSTFTRWSDGARYRIRARATDGFVPSAWAECDFRLAVAVDLDGGAGAGADASADAGTDAGTDAGAGSDAGSHPAPDAGPASSPVSGCACNSTAGPGTGAVALVVLSFAARRRRGRRGGAR